MISALTLRLTVLPPAATGVNGWHWGLGDPSLGAVLVTALYFLAAVACLVAMNSRGLPVFPPTAVSRSGLQKGFWFLLFLLLFLLGVNKQADLQSLLTVYGRDGLHQLGLYEQRRGIQVAFIAGVTAFTGAGVLAVCWRVARWPWPFHLAGLGIAIQAAFVVVRAASFHHVDRMLGWQFSSVKFNLILESIGLLMILVAAVAVRRSAGIAEQMSAG